jgi:hypothetical protein
MSLSKSPRHSTRRPPANSHHRRFVSSLALPIGGVPDRVNADEEASIPDTEAWGSPGATEYADDADDERL